MDVAERFSLAGKVALVIGGSSGIGREIALGFREAGARVVPVGTSYDKVQEVVARLRETDPEAEGHAVDVREIAALQVLVDDVAERLGRIDVLVNSQGRTQLRPAEDFTEAEYDQIMAVNLKSLFFACTLVGRKMLAQGEGSIINIASVASFLGFQKSAVYTASKHGVIGITRTLAAEWAARGVRVNAIAPGFFLTALNRDKMDPARKAAAQRRTPMDRFGELPELVGAAIYLASPAAAYVTGETLGVHGGYLAAGL
jgi:NAD(P)-dependent dehydrogenase (short-subunit alcohol dehydrogenase family)